MKHSTKIGSLRVLALTAALSVSGLAFSYIPAQADTIAPPVAVAEITYDVVIAQGTTVAWPIIMKATVKQPDIATIKDVDVTAIAEQPFFDAIEGKTPAVIPASLYVAAKPNCIDGSVANVTTIPGQTPVLAKTDRIDDDTGSGISTTSGGLAMAVDGAGKTSMKLARKQTSG